MPVRCKDKMDMVAQTTDEHRAPGTVTIEDLQRNKLIRQPRPSPDPEQPLNWSKLRKSVNYAIVCFYALMTFVELDIGTVIWYPLNTELGLSYDSLTNSFAVNLAGLAIGCIFLIPLSSIYGRRPVYLISTLVQFATAVWQAKMNTLGDLYGTNIVSGLAGAVSESIVQMTISDLFFVHQRATMNAIYLWMVNMGAYLAPVAAGYCASSQGWRWIWWWTSIFLGVSFLFQLFAYEETKYTPRLPSIRTGESPTSDNVTTAKDDDAMTNELQKSRTEASANSVGWAKKSFRERFALYTLTPGGSQGYFSIIWECFVLLKFPAVAYTSLMWGSSLAWFSVTLNTLSVYFTLPPYSFGPSAIGLMNLAPFTGSQLALFIAPLNDWLILQLAKRNGGVFEPEMRLWMGLAGAVIAPAGMLLYGLTLAKGFAWITPAVGLAVFGFGWALMSDTSLTYLQDCYTEVVGRALVPVAFWRNGLSMMFVFVLTPWINADGLYNMFIAASILAWVLYATTIPMLIWGGKWRAQTAKAYWKLTRGSAE